jgi:hypothetical protein
VEKAEFFFSLPEVIRYDHDRHQHLCDRALAGITFLFDPKTATLVGELVIDYDNGPGFTLYDESVPRSLLDCKS